MRKATLADVRTVVGAAHSDMERASVETLQKHYGHITRVVRMLPGDTPPERAVLEILGRPSVLHDVSTIRSFVMALHRELNPHQHPARSRRCVAHG